MNVIRLVIHLIRYGYFGNVLLFCQFSYDSCLTRVDFGIAYVNIIGMFCSGDRSRTREHDPLPKSTHGQTVKRMSHPYRETGRR